MKPEAWGFEDKLGGELYSTAISIYRDVISIMPNKEWAHWSQCANAMGSVVANIAEGTGKSGKGNKYYQNFCLHSRGSAFEVVAWLQIGVIDGTINESSATTLGEQLLALGDALLQEVKNPVARKPLKLTLTKRVENLEHTDSL